jgi:pyruvate dehydrogenase E2 component (dihydrolipoamide acetyltransferase)
MATPVIMPRQGQSVETCILGQWYKKPGDPVSVGDLLFSYETDKSSFEEEAKTSGTLIAVFFSQGDEIPVLINVAVIGEPGESAEPFRPVQKKLSEATPASPTVERQITRVSDEILFGGRIKISPLAKKMAELAGVNLPDIKGTGPHGRIIARDIRDYKQLEKPATENIIITSDDFEVRPLTNIRRIIASTMAKSMQNSAQVTHHMSADARKILAFREAVTTALKKKKLDENISLHAILCWCIVRALKKHPAVNSHFLGDSIKTFNKVHLGFAVDTRSGLMVPTIKNVDDFSLAELSAEAEELRHQCMTRKINPDLLANEAASFSVSNLEAYGVEMFTPVINLPQVAIIGINAITLRPVELEGVFQFAPHIGLSLTYDHRAIDGGPATLFLRSVKQEIERFNQPLF